MEKKQMKQKKGIVSLLASQPLSEPLRYLAGCAIIEKAQGGNNKKSGCLEEGQTPARAGF